MLASIEIDQQPYALRLNYRLWDYKYVQVGTGQGTRVVRREYTSALLHLEQDSPAFKKAVLDVDREAEQFNLEVDGWWLRRRPGILSTEDQREVEAFETRASKIKADFEAQLNSFAQGISDLQSAIVNHSYKTHCECCPPVS
ncbi:MAG: hypothetical protein ACLPY5_08400 [Candidatus Bathyarchaeia archaeon]